MRQLGHLFFGLCGNSSRFSGKDVWRHLVRRAQLCVNSSRERVADAGIAVSAAQGQLSAEENSFRIADWTVAFAAAI